MTQAQLTLFAHDPSRRPRRTHLERDRERIRAAGKKCSGKCGRWRPWRDFHRRSALPDGYQSRCKYCGARGKGNEYGKRRPAPEVERSCKACLGLAHARPSRGCARCGQPYRPIEHEIEQEKQRIREGFGLGVGFNYPNNDGV
jgi:hypothetical protein